MKKYLFREVAHLYTGCFMYSAAQELALQQRRRTYVPTVLTMTDNMTFRVGASETIHYWDNTEYKPLLKKMADLPPEERATIKRLAAGVRAFDPDSPDADSLATQSFALFHYLLEQQIDLFGLVERGEAVAFEIMTLAYIFKENKPQ